MANSRIETQIKKDSAEFQKNRRALADRLAEIKKQEEQIRQGGGAKAIESQHKKDRLTARERIAKLIDPGTHFFELGLYAGFEMYEEWAARRRRGRLRDLDASQGGK